MAETIKWFLANKYRDPDDDIDAWTADLVDILTAEANKNDTGWVAEVIPGRDDFRENGQGFKRGDSVVGTWEEDVYSRVDPWTGFPVYDGIVVPVSAERGLVLGRPTDDMIKGFLARPDHDGFVLAYNVGHEDFVIGDLLGLHVVIPAGGLAWITGTVPTSSDSKRSYATWSKLILAGMESKPRRGQADRPAGGYTDDPKHLHPVPSSEADEGDGDYWETFVSQARRQAAIARGLARYVPKASEWAAGQATFLDSMADTAEKGSFCTQKMINALHSAKGKIANWTDRLDPGVMAQITGNDPPESDGDNYLDEWDGPF